MDGKQFVDLYTGRHVKAIAPNGYTEHWKRVCGTDKGVVIGTLTILSINEGGDPYGIDVLLDMKAATTKNGFQDGINEGLVVAKKYVKLAKSCYVAVSFAMKPVIKLVKSAIDKLKDK